MSNWSKRVGLSASNCNFEVRACLKMVPPPKCPTRPDTKTQPATLFQHKSQTTHRKCWDSFALKTVELEWRFCKIISILIHSGSAPVKFLRWSPKTREVSSWLVENRVAAWYSMKIASNTNGDDKHAVDNLLVISKNMKRLREFWTNHELTSRILGLQRRNFTGALP